MGTADVPTGSETAALVERLTPRQRDVLELLTKGLTNDELGHALGISAATVRTHVTAILQQLEVSNRTEAAAAFSVWQACPARVAEVLARPAIAVLPIVALDEHARARTAAGGISYDLAALFARWCWFPVIADRRVEAGEDAARALGARFLVDGALRLGGEAWRLTVRLTDAESHHCLWTERYDFPGHELFAIQDAVCEAIVASCYAVILSRARVAATAGTGELQAWALAHDGMRLQAVREHDTNVTAQARFRAAIARQPDLVLAHFGLGLTCYDDVLNQWSEPEVGRERLLECAERCTDLAPHAAEGHYLLGRHHQTLGDHHAAARALEAAIARNPSFAAAHALLAQALQITGRSDEALVRMKHAQRLGPRSFVAGLATLHFERREYAEALDAAERSLVSNPRYPFARALASASAWWLGEAARAGEHARRLRADFPSFAPRSFLKIFGAEVEAVERLAQALEQVPGIG